MFGSALAEGVGAAIGAAGGGLGLILQDFDERILNGDASPKNNNVSSSSDTTGDIDNETVTNQKRIRKLLSEHDFRKVGPRGHDIQAERKAQSLGLSLNLGDNPKAEDLEKFETEVLPLLKVQNLRILGEDPNDADVRQWLSDNDFVLKEHSDNYWTATHEDLSIAWRFGDDGERNKAVLKSKGKKAAVTSKGKSDATEKSPEEFEHLADFETGALQLTHAGKTLKPEITDPGKRLIHPDGWNQGGFLNFEETLANLAKLSKKEMAHIELKRIATADYDTLGINHVTGAQMFFKPRNGIDHILTLHDKPSWGESQLTSKNDRGFILETFFVSKVPRMRVEHIIYPPF